MKQFRVDAFDILGDPVRRRILELLAAGAEGPPVPAGEIAAAVGAEFGISQPAVSQHLKVLRESGFTAVSIDGPRRLYSVQAAPFREVDAWLDRHGRFWERRLDALDTEIHRSRRARASRPGRSAPRPSPKEKP